MIAGRLQSIQSELPSGVELVAVSKFHPAEEILEAYAAGQRAFGENRPQEFAAKVPALPADIRWHFIGHLQTNKLKLVLPYAALVQSVDSRHLLDAIQAWGAAAGRVIPILLELHLGAEETKGGFTQEEIAAVMEEYASGAASLSCVRIRGLMGMATNTGDEAVIRSDFARIRALKDRLSARYPALDDFSELSIGMSGDWRIALEYGATIVRIGTAIFGPRK
ncbi:MAG: YggS family pyridoxal phosphate-dependent enzyme [Bacteroidales bacterium]|nr:YggS family pyridoxal phosphate-dependent enzyme [Bacteroidales bacterium]